MYCFIELFAPHITREWLDSYINREALLGDSTSPNQREQALPMH